MPAPPELFRADGFGVTVSVPSEARELERTELPQPDVSRLPGASIIALRGWDGEGAIVRAGCVRGPSSRFAPGIEEVLYEHPAIELAAVVGEPDAYAGELPVAFVQLKPGTTADPAELLKYAADRTPERAAVPVQLYILNTIPLTAVGKEVLAEGVESAAQRDCMRSLGCDSYQGFLYSKPEPNEEFQRLIRSAG